MSTVETIKLCVSLIAASGTILGSFWAIAKIFIAVYDHVRDVQKLKKDSVQLQRADKDIKYSMYRLLQQNKDLIQDMQKTVRQIQQEVLKIAIKCNLTAPDFKDDD